MNLPVKLATNHPNILYWEKIGKVAKTEYLVPMAKALGVTIDEVLGEPRPRKTIIAGGRMGLLLKKLQSFLAVSKIK